MTISAVLKAGRKQWCVHFRDIANDNVRPYRRRFFRTKALAEEFVRQREQDERALGGAWMAMPSHMRQELVEAHAEAAAAGVSVTKAIRKAIASAKVTPRTISDIVAEYVQSKRARGLRHRSLLALSNRLKLFADSVPTGSAEEITPQQIQYWLNSREAGATYRSGLLDTASSLFKYAIRMGYLTRNPCDVLERPIVPRKETPVLTPEQAERLFRVVEADHPTLIGFLALAALAGFRPESEVARMTRADVRHGLALGFLTPPVDNKTRRRRAVPVCPSLRAWLDVWLPLNVEPVYRTLAWRKQWDDARKKAGLWPWPQNVLRHSRVSYRLAETGDEIKTAAEDGHSTDVLHAHYKALVSKQDAERYFAIFPKLNSPS